MLIGRKESNQTNKNLSIVGEIISGSEEEDDEEAETNEEDAEAYMQEQQAKLEDEKNAILNNQNMLQSVSIVTLAQTY